MVPSSLTLKVLESIASGVLDLSDPSLGLNDEMLHNLPWPKMSPFLVRISVRQKDVTCLPIGLANLSAQIIKKIHFEADHNWRKLDKIKAGESAESIIDYCKAKLEGGIIKMKAMRLMVMGGPAVGKTTMIRRLRACESGEKFDLKSFPLSTDGVELGDVKLEDGTILETWDFGGQKIYRVSHQLFLRDFCIYAVMCRVNDPLKEALKELRFWIDSIFSRTEKAQVLLITTHGDRLKRKEAEAAHNRLHRALLVQYGEQKICPNAVMLHPSLHHKSPFFPHRHHHHAKEDKGAVALMNELQKMSDLIAFDAPAPLEMLRVALESLGRPIVKISLVHQVIQQIGEKSGVAALRDEERRMKYLKDLDTLGFIYLVRSRRMLSLNSSTLASEDDSPLEMAVVLSPHWVSRLLATLITTKHTFAQSAGGVIDHDTLTRLLWKKEEDFPKEHHEDMIDLLIQLHIMFPLRSSPSDGRDQQQKYFVPCLLKEDEPQHTHGILRGFGFQIAGQNRVVLNRILKMKNQVSVPVAVLPMVIVQLMKIGEVIECWQQGCTVVISSRKDPAKVECCCLVKRNQGDELTVSLEGVSSEVAGWWMNEVMRSLSNMLEEFYHVDYSVIVMYHGGKGGGGGCCASGCAFSFNYLYGLLAQRKVTALCQKKTHKVALQFLIPDLLIQKVSSLSLVCWEDLEIEKELGQGSFGKVLLCSSSKNFQTLKKGKKKKKEKEKELKRKKIKRKGSKKKKIKRRNKKGEVQKGREGKREGKDASQ